MKETPVNKIMENTLEKMREMVDVSTIIGDPMVTGDTTLIPVSKVTYGFTSGGTDLPTKQQNQELFGGGGGGGITITPVAFIVIEKGKCRMSARYALQVQCGSGEALDLPVPGGQHHHFRELCLRRQCAAGQKVLRSAYRFLPG